MNINFKVNEKDYSLTSDQYQMYLNEVKIVQSGKNKGEETLNRIGCFKNEFMAFKFLLGYEKYTSECTTMVELEKLTRDTMEQLNKLIEIYTMK